MAKPIATIERFTLDEMPENPHLAVRCDLDAEKGHLCVYVAFTEGLIAQMQATPQLRTYIEDARTASSTPYSRCNKSI